MEHITEQIMSSVDALKIIMLIGIVAAMPICFFLGRSNKELAEKNRLAQLALDRELGIENDSEERKAHAA